MEPADRISTGCVAFRLTSHREICCRMTTGSPGSNANVAATTTDPWGRPEERYTQGTASRFRVRSSPPPVTRRTRARRSATEPPQAPAFPHTAPPTVPGTPLRISIPPRPCLLQKASRRLTRTPAPAVTSAPSRASSWKRLGRITIRRPSDLKGGVPRHGLARQDLPPYPAAQFRRQIPRGSHHGVPRPPLPNPLPTRGRGRGGGQPPDDLFPDLPDVARAHGHHDVTRPGHRQHGVHEVFLYRDEGDALVTVVQDGLGDLPTVDPRNRPLAGRIDLGHEQPVRLIEGRGKVLEQGLGPSVAVRLEQGDDIALEAGLGRIQGGLDLRWMVGVVIDRKSVV